MKLKSRRKYEKWEKKYNLIENTKIRMRGIIKFQSVARGRIVRKRILENHAKEVRDKAIKSFYKSCEEKMLRVEKRKEQTLQQKLRRQHIADLKKKSEEVFAEIQFQLLEMKYMRNGNE